MARRPAPDAPMGRSEPEGPVLLPAGAAGDGMTAAAEALYIGLTYLNGEVKALEGEEKEAAAAAAAAAGEPEPEPEPEAEAEAEPRPASAAMVTLEPAEEGLADRSWTELHAGSEGRFAVRPGADGEAPVKKGVFATRCPHARIA